MWFQADGLEIDVLTVKQDPDSCVKDVLCRVLKLENTDISKCLIRGKSIDSRRSPKFVYSLFVETAVDLSKLRSPLKISASNEECVNAKFSPILNIPHNNVADAPVIVVGTGPAGIFAALGLVRAKFKVIIIDRGKKVDERSQDWQRFLRTRKLDEESNLLIGEGGAGTFSDGKLFTRTKDTFSDFVLKTFVDHGAAADTIYLKRPHIGSDVLPEVARSMRREIESAGGEFRFGTEVISVIIEDGGTAKGVITRSGEKIYGAAVIIAHGLGGRELTMSMIRAGIPHELKGFQIGCRIEHPQKLIDRHQYHLNLRPETLTAAEYNFVSAPDQKMNIKGVSTFCMCPGGEVVMASAWRNSLTSNGMSLHARDGRFANSCLIMSIDGKDFPNAESAYGFLRSLEQQAFKAGGADYTLPAQSAAGFLNGKEALIYSDSSVSTGVRSARLDLLFPRDMRNALRRALLNFQRKCPFFIDCGQFAGIETCVSSPVRFIRDPETLASAVSNLYLCGEGAGYAGGIMSGAIDGLKTARSLAERLNRQSLVL